MAAKKMCFECQPFIKKGSKILDLGCGSGIIGKEFQKFFQADLIGVDVKDLRVFDIPFKIIDGKFLPFPEKTFDVVLVNYVLHHSGDPIFLLKEAKRVGQKIIVYEDLPEGFLSRMILWLHGTSFDKVFGNLNRTSFKKGQEWEENFNQAGLNLIFKKEIKNFPVKKKLFILEGKMGV